jgi:hypothetical protein
MASPELVVGLTASADVHPPPVSPCALDELPTLEGTDTGRSPKCDAESLGRRSEDEEENGRACCGWVGKDPASPTGTSARDKSFSVSK